MLPGSPAPSPSPACLGCRASFPAAHGVARRVCAGAGHLQPGRLLAHPRALPQQPHRGHGGLQLRYLPRPGRSLWPGVPGGAAGPGAGRGERAPRRRAAHTHCRARRCRAACWRACQGRACGLAPLWRSAARLAPTRLRPLSPACLQGGDLGAALGDATSSWRPLLWWLAPPGLALAALAVATVEEPREKSSSGRYLPLVTLSASSMDEDDAPEPQGGAAAAAGAAAAGLAPPHRTLVSLPEQEAPAPGLGDSIRLLLSSRSFVALTAATSFGDIASWALIGWQATYYQVRACTALPRSMAGLEWRGRRGARPRRLAGDASSRACRVAAAAHCRVPLLRCAAAEGL